MPKTDGEARENDVETHREGELETCEQNRIEVHRSVPGCGGFGAHLAVKFALPG
jgi:hypothetical protein